MKVLITGGLGNLGLWLTEHFLEQGYHVTVLGRSERVFIKHENYQFLCADITDINSLKTVINSYFDYCIHAASFNEHFEKNYSEDALKINALGTEFLCQALLVQGVGKLIYLSTFHVYGQTEGVVSEKSPIKPVNDYGLTHFFAEKYIEKHAKINGLKYVNFRLTNSYGCPKDINTDKWYLILNDLCYQAHTTNKIVLSSNGKSVRDFIWMGDVVKVIELIANDERCTNQLLNISSDIQLSIIQLAETVKLAYEDFTGSVIKITVDKTDDSEFSELCVSNKKLLSYIEYEFSNVIYDESINIFKFIGLESEK